MLIFGNGGSAADAQHFACELVGRFLRERRALPADRADDRYEHADGDRQRLRVRSGVRAADRGARTAGRRRRRHFDERRLGKRLAGLQYARSRGLKTVAFTGGDGGPIGAAADVHVNVPHERHSPRAGSASHADSRGLRSSIEQQITDQHMPETSHRDDDRQHGAAAPQHARRAPAGARARWRDHRVGGADYRLSAHRHREDRGAEEVSAGHSARRAHGLPERAVQRVRVLPLGREAARPRDARSREVDPRAARRAAAHQQPSRVARHARHGSRRDVGDALLLPRARAAARHQRAHRRLPAVSELHPRRRPSRGSAARLSRGRHAVPRQLSGQARRVRRSC